MSLQLRAERRRSGELGAHEFQRWLERWKCERRRGRAVEVWIATDDSHAVAVEP